MIGSGASGNWRRASLRSPPCRSGVEIVSGIMAITLTLLALLIEATFGYPDWLGRTIGHPVTWMGRVISWLDRSLNREDMGIPWRRTAGMIALIVTIGTVAVIAHILEVTLYELPF